MQSAFLFLLLSLFPMIFAKDDKTPLRICLFVEPSPFTYMSGYANRFQALLNYLANKHPEDDVKIVTTEVVNTKNLPQIWLGFPIHYTAGFRLPHYPLMSLSWDYTFRSLRTVAHHRPHIIHASSPGFLVLSAALISRMFSIPLLVSYHTHLPIYVRTYLPKLFGLPEWIVWQWIRWVHHVLADVTIVTSPQIQQEFQQHGIDQVMVWPKGVDTETFHPRYKDETMRVIMTDGHKEDFLVVYVGRIATEKGLHLLPEIMKRLPPNVRLSCIGNGPYEAELRSLLLPTERAFFTGPLQGRALSKAFASADVFVMPSTSETLGFVVLESMASGVPVVAARAGGLVDLIRDGETGFLVTPNDADEYANRICQLRSDVGLRDKMANRARLDTETWSWTASMETLRNQYYSVARQNMRLRWEQRLWNMFSFQGTSMCGWQSEE
ncbi:N-acetyllactosaminide 3-alpha-galactosyltransferase [Fistulifera solaris]|uniref:N-acetyllactosaminide 3-alpha-galactosyltransferase n=1 Tax=Fistulifera solaris TaxID=1519565 RepID=A0A1Z5JAJ5_FISSO|nr:N-acetyllactosaminide 3-alpha-galactosyltransferase [Fistulifera solaris]|eukprot:GAX10986.1 N-acetyllactosaminide 3-alpha-galactosyltransferase [Fistulifera solaris]